MSQRDSEKERLASLLEAGRITRAVYEERLARLGQRGKSSVKRKQGRNYIANWLRAGLIDEREADRRLSELERTGILEPLPKEWSPSAAPAAPRLGSRSGVRLDTCTDAALIAEVQRRGYVISKPL